MAVYLTVRDLRAIRAFYTDEEYKHVSGDPETFQKIEAAISAMHFSEDDVDDMIETIKLGDTYLELEEGEKILLEKLQKLSTVHAAARLRKKLVKK